MKFCALIIFASLFTIQSYSQTSPVKPALDSSLLKKITISDFSLCQTTLDDLRNRYNDLKEVEVEEMDLPKNCGGEDSRFVNGRGFYSPQNPGIIFQMDQDQPYVSKFRLTKDFNGVLPNGLRINMKTLLVKDVFAMYPDLKEKWRSRGCSSYWNISNDTLSFYVKIDAARKPQFPVDEVYYNDKPVEAIDLVVSCYSIFAMANHKLEKLPGDAVFFVDSMNVSRFALQDYAPEQIAAIHVYKDTNAIKLIGADGADGVVYIETKRFLRKQYWTFFSSRSDEYRKAISSFEDNDAVVYILNGTVLEKDIENTLSAVNAQNFLDLKIIGKDLLKKNYGIKTKKTGVVIRTRQSP